MLSKVKEKFKYLNPEYISDDDIIKSSHPKTELRIK